MDDLNHGVKTLLYLLEQRLQHTGGDLQEVLQRLVDAGCVLHEDSAVGVSMLHSMIARGRADDVRLLLARGDPGLVNCSNHCGNMPLHVAANTKHLDVLGVLLERGAEVNRQRTVDKYSPLHSAALGGMVGAARRLLEAGADVRAANLYGNNALHLAAGMGHVELLDVLLAAGAPLEDHNSIGNTPLANAARNDHSAVVERLLKAGADPDVLYAQNHALLEVMMKERLPYVALQLVRYGAALPALRTITDWLRPDMDEREMLVFLALVLSGNDSSSSGTSMQVLRNAHVAAGQLPRSLRTWVDAHAAAPLPLNFLCRQRVRRLLMRAHPGALGASVESLPLPAPIMNFLLLADLSFTKTPMRIVFRTEHLRRPSATPWTSSSPQLKLVIELDT